MRNRALETLLQHADDEGSRALLTAIIEESAKMRKDNTVPTHKGTVELRLFGYIFHMKRACAPSSLDILYDIFVTGDHQEVAGFDGTDASVAVDVGANDGYYLMRLKQRNPDICIYAFEPNPGAYENLVKNVEENKITSVEHYNTAVSDVTQEEPFELVDEISAIGGFRIWRYRPWLDPARIRTVTVPTITLDEALEGIGDIDILKIDVEGAEYRVLKGAQKTLPRIKRIVVECHGDELRGKVRRYLIERGYTLVLEQEREMGDLYFVRA
jgi:FkbM family methyltransferase